MAMMGRLHVQNETRHVEKQIADIVDIVAINHLPVLLLYT